MEAVLTSKESGDLAPAPGPRLASHSDRRSEICAETSEPHSLFAELYSPPARY